VSCAYVCGVLVYVCDMSTSKCLVHMYASFHIFTRVRLLSPINVSFPDIYDSFSDVQGEVGGWGRDQKKCTGRDWGIGSSTI